MADQEKRKLLKSIGSAVGAAIGGGVVGALITDAWEDGDVNGYPIQAIRNAFTGAEEYPTHRLSRSSMSKAVAIFFNTGKDVYTIRDRHHNIANPFSPAVRAAHNSLILSLKEHLNVKINEVDSFENVIVNGKDFICFGSPSSNLSSRYLMGYFERDGNIVKDLSSRSIDLPFHYICDRNEAKDLPLVRRRYDGKTKYNYNWFLKDSDLNPIVPYVDSKGVLIDDYLLITSIPTTLSSPNRSRTVIVGGTHGPGTAAFSLLLSNEYLIGKLSDFTQRHKYWQALFRIDKLEEKSNEMTIPVSISDEIELYPIDIPKKILQADI